MHDVPVTTRFYLDYLGCTLDSEEGEGDRPVYMQVSRGDLVLQLSSHHDDGTPGSAVLMETTGVEALWGSFASATTRFSIRASSLDRAEAESFS